MSKVDRQVQQRMASRVAEREAWNQLVFEAVRTWDADMECAHGCLPADLSPSCGCWEGLTVREAEALRHDIQALAKELRRSHEELHAAIRALTEVLAHVDRNVTAVGYSVSENGR